MHHLIMLKTRNKEKHVVGNLKESDPLLAKFQVWTDLFSPGEQWKGAFLCNRFERKLLIMNTLFGTLVGKKAWRLTVRKSQYQFGNEIPCVQYRWRGQFQNIAKIAARLSDLRDGMFSFWIWVDLNPRNMNGNSSAERSWSIGIRRLVNSTRFRHVPREIVISNGSAWCFQSNSHYCHYFSLLMLAGIHFTSEDEHPTHYPRLEH